MRAFVLLALVACAEPPRRPPQLPADPNGVENCRSSPAPPGGVRYACGSYDVYDNSMEPISIRSIEHKLVTTARARGVTASSRLVEVDGVEDAIVVEYTDKNQHAFELVVVNPSTASSVRMLQCHVPWFQNASSIPTRESTCARTIALLLKRPPPAAHELTPDCKRATALLPKLPGRTDPADNSPDLHNALREFAARCTDAVAACVLASKSYVQATLCRE